MTKSVLLLLLVFFWCCSIVKHIFCHVVCMLLISLLANLEVTSSLRFCLFLLCFMRTKSIVWWLLTHCFWSSVFCEGQLSLVSMYPPVFTVIESRSCSIVEVLSLYTLFHVDKIHSLMFADPLLLEFSHLWRSAFAWYHFWSGCHFWRV